MAADSHNATVDAQQAALHAAAEQAVTRVVRVMAEDVARGVPPKLAPEQAEQYRRGQWSTFSASIHTLRSVRKLPFSPTDHCDMMIDLVRCTDVVQAEIDRRILDAGRFCPNCGHLPVADYNTLPQTFWRSTVQSVTCEHCRAHLQRRSAADGAPVREQVWQLVALPTRAH